MTHSRSLKNRLLFFLTAGLGLLLGSSSPAQLLTTPLYVGASDAIVNEFGDVLDGQASAPGDLIQLYQAVNGVIHPPGVDGAPHPDNIPLPGGTSAIGYLAPIGLQEPGMFNLAINGAQRPGDGVDLFVRVFNAAMLEEASFYGDSQLFTVDGNKAFSVVIGAADIPLNPGDDDMDGLNNSFEKSLGTSSSSGDTDGDGAGDLHEFRAGTDGQDANSTFIVGAIHPDGEDVLVSWDSVPGRTYQVEGCADLTGDSFVPVGAAHCRGR